MRTALMIAAMLLISACSSIARTPEPQEQAGAAIALVAAQLVGTPYHFGGADLQGFDCSGLAFYAHERVGLEIPRTAEEQRHASRPAPLATLAPCVVALLRICVGV